MHWLIQLWQWHNPYSSPFSVHQLSDDNGSVWIVRLYLNLKETSKNMFTFLNFIKCCICFLFVVLVGAREIHFEAHSSFRFDNFEKHKCRYLQVSKHSETRVREFADCAMKCLTTPPCISLNMASSPDGGQMFWCELLFSDKFNNSLSYKENATSHHFSRWVSFTII